MINPQKITDYKRSPEQLQEFLLFCICVAGKNSRVQAQKLAYFITEIYFDYVLSPIRPDKPKGIFEVLSSYTEEEITKFLKSVKMGQYTRISKAFKACSQIKCLQTITLEELLKVDGIGPKTARFFLLHTRPNARCAVLDTHILKFIRKYEIDETAPKSTPQSPKRYRELEEKFLDFFEQHYSHLYTLADFDLTIWKRESNG